MIDLAELLGYKPSEVEKTIKGVINPLLKHHINIAERCDKEGKTPDAEYWHGTVNGILQATQLICDYLTRLDESI